MEARRRAKSRASRLQVKAINDPFMDLTYMVYQLKYDSVHKQYPGTIATKVADGKEFLVIDGKDWKGMGLSLVQIGRAS